MRALVSRVREQRVVELFRAFDAFAAMKASTDAEVAEMLLELWADYPITSPQSALIQQTIARLQRTGLGELVEADG